MAWVLEEYPYSVISKERISEQIYIFYSEKEFRGEKIGLIRKSEASNSDYSNYISKLERAGILVSFGSDGRRYLHHTDHLSNIYSISGKPEYGPNEAACTVYPHGYISKISAMSWYGITDKIPSVVRFTACSASEWKKRSIAELSQHSVIPPSKYSQFIPKYPKNNSSFNGGFAVSSERQYQEPVKVKGSPIKVSSIGRTFIDMLRSPDECGGIEHVLDVYEEYGKKYSTLIIKELEKVGRKIDIARVGFALHKISGVSDKKLDAWQKEAQLERGSSKVLVPGVPFSPIFDEDWSLSLNNEHAQKYGNRY